MACYRLIQEIAPDINPVGVEASMRLEYGSITDLPRAVFVEEARVAAEVEHRCPGYLRGVADSFGRGWAFDYWEERRRLGSPTPRS